MTKNTSAHSKGASYRKRRKFRWLYLLLLIITAFFYTLLNIRVAGIFPSHGDCSLTQESRANPIEKLVYAPLMNHQFRSVSWPQIEVVTLTPDIEPSIVLNDVCTGRQFLADLVVRLAERGAAVIAIDKYFSDKSCDEKRNEGIDKAFREALLKASSLSRLVLGQSAHLRPNAVSQSDCLVADPPFTLKKEDPGALKQEVKPASDSIQFGLTRVNQNTLRIPLQWWVFDSNISASNLHDPADKHLDGFALAASKAMDPLIENREDLKFLLGRSEHPYGSFSKIISKSNAIDVLCVDAGLQQTKNYAWGICPSTRGYIADFKGKLVVVGQISDQDKEAALGGKEEYGLFLQANYIGSLLNDRYVHRVPVWIDVTMLFLLFAIPVIIENLLPKDFLTSWHAFAYILGTVVAFTFSGFVALYGFHVFAPISFLSLYSVTGLLLAGFLLRVMACLNEKHFGAAK